MDRFVPRLCPNVFGTIQVAHLLLVAVSENAQLTLSPIWERSLKIAGNKRELSTMLLSTRQ
jgi:hypothetical protein